MNVTLIGMPGVGKSTIGKELARKMGRDYKFIDVDEIIRAELCKDEKVDAQQARLCERPGEFTLEFAIRELGEHKVMCHEEQAVLALGKGKALENTVIATGGSVIYSENAMRFLKGHSTIVFVDDSVSRILPRVEEDWDRGIIWRGERGESAFEKLAEKRGPEYKRWADITYRIPDMRGFDPPGIAADIAALLRDREKSRRVKAG